MFSKFIAPVSTLAACTARTGVRSLSTTAVRAGTPLFDRVSELVPKEQARLRNLVEEYGDVIVDEVSVDQIVGGARGIKSMIWLGSNLDANEGIRFRGLTIPQVQEVFPGEGEPKPESLLWLLLTGDVPTLEQEESVTAELHARSALPAGVEDLINSLPKTMHPMSQFAASILYLQQDSVFKRNYDEGISKKEYWKGAYEDVMNLTARLPRVAALIYRNVFHDAKIADYDSSLDYSANFARMLGFNDATFDELMRLYLTIHTDHEGGNASAHTAHLVASTLSDPYLATAGAMASLAGPLHGLANQEVLRWVKDLKATFDERGLEVNQDTIREFAWETLNGGKVIPGFGHAVLRITDPRYTCQREFALKHMPDDELVNVVAKCYEVMPDVLTEHGKTKNPFPNVDAHSGVLLVHYGLTEENFYTVLFGVSRSIGCGAQLFWDRALGLPLERPKSLTIEGLEALAKEAAAKN